MTLAFVAGAVCATVFWGLLLAAGAWVVDVVTRHEARTPTEDSY